MEMWKTSRKKKHQNTLKLNSYIGSNGKYGDTIRGTRYYFTLYAGIPKIKQGTLLSLDMQYIWTKGSGLQ